MKLKKAAKITARTGESTRVETTVAMELAASWNPLVKSKIRAIATIIATITYVEFIKTSRFEAPPVLQSSRIGISATNEHGYPRMAARMVGNKWITRLRKRFVFIRAHSWL